jgi:hypothetical protein
MNIRHGHIDTILIIRQNDIIILQSTSTADSCFHIIGYTGNKEKEKRKICKDEKAYNNSQSDRRAATRESSKLHLSEVRNDE